MFHLFSFINLQTHVNQLYSKSQKNYLNKVVKKLCDPMTSSKCDWSLLKTLSNNQKNSMYCTYMSQYQVHC